MFSSPQATWKILDWVLLVKILHKKCLSELINKWNYEWICPDGGSFSELSDSNMCKVNSPFSSSSSEEEEVVQPEPDRGTKRTRRTLPKHTNKDSELEWKEQIQTVQTPAFSGVPGINKNLHINQDSSPWDVFEIFFSLEVFQLIQKETNRYAMQKTNKKKQEGPLKPKSLLAQWIRVSLQEIKKNSFR